MDNRTKFFLGLIPAVLLVIAAEAVVPALVVDLVTWSVGDESFLLLFFFGAVTAIAIAVTSFNAIWAVGEEMGVLPYRT